MTVNSNPYRIFLLGKYGQLGWELERTMATIGEVISLDYPEIDLTQPDQISDAVRQTQPAVIVNATAYTAVDRAESEQENARALNARAPRILAEEARKMGAALIHYSTDYIFDGSKKKPYLEMDSPNPLSIYGQSKLEGELAVQGVGDAHLILRTSWVYSLRRECFVTKVLEWSRHQEILRVVTDQVSNPTWARMLAEITAQLLAKAGTDPVGWLRERSGLYHLAGGGYTSRFEWARAILQHDPHQDEQLTKQILPALTAEYPSPAKRPRFTALNCDLFASTFDLRMPDWQDSLILAMADVP